LKEIEYKCNICHDICQNRSGTKKEFIGIYWEYVKDSKKNHYVEKPFRESENHLCLNCIKDIHEIYLTIKSRYAESN
jgi:hypothetical protein